MDRHGSQHPLAGIHTLMFVEPPCETLKNGSAHPAPHLIDAEGRRIGVLSISCISEGTLYPPKAGCQKNRDKRNTGSDISAQQPVQRERAWVTRGCKALEGRSFHGFLKRPRKAKANLLSYIKTGVDREKQKPWIF